MMISGTFHISENSTAWDEGWNARPASASLQLSAATYMKIKSVSIRLGCNGANDSNGNFYFILNNVQVFTESYTLKAEYGNSQWVSFGTNIIINIGDSVNLYTETGGGRQARAYYGTSGSFPLGAINNPTNAAEMILDIDYVPIWTIDGQNDGYAYPTDTDPTEFTKFAKDMDGYPLNWGVWKLDDQNEGYPWPTGYLPNSSYIKISTLNEFIDFSNGEYGRGSSSRYLNVVLTTDIDFLNSDIYSWAGCTGTWYINFDGQGHSIKNIVYTNVPNWSLFETIYGTLQNLVLEDICVTSTNGNVAGFAYNCYASISNCRITGYLASYSHAIGLVYLARNAVTIRNCLFEGTLVSFYAETMAFSLDGGNCRFVKCGFMGLMKASSTLSPFANSATCEDCFYSGMVNGVTLRPYSYHCNCIRCYFAIDRNSIISRAVQDNSTATNCCFDAQEASAGNFLNMITDIFPSATQAQTQQLKDINWLTGIMGWSADVWTTGEENNGYAYIKDVIPSGFEYFDTDEHGIAKNKLVWRINNIYNEEYPWPGELQQAFEYFETDEDGYPNNSSVWKIDDQNEGYPWITGHFPNVFEYFETDEDGYPKNFSVWKLDSQNDGYPWITGFLAMKGDKGDMVRILKKPAWQPVEDKLVYTQERLKDSYWEHNKKF